MADKVMIRRALYYVQKLKQRQAEYQEECESYYRQGYQPHYCIHGMNLWTDYDPICGPCEDGYGIYELALMYARKDYANYLARLEWLNSFPPNQPMPRELTSTLISWVTSPILERVNDGR